MSIMTNPSYSVIFLSYFLVTMPVAACATTKRLGSALWIRNGRITRAYAQDNFTVRGFHLHGDQGPLEYFTGRLDDAAEDSREPGFPCGSGGNNVMFPVSRSFPLVCTNAVEVEIGKHVGPIRASCS